MIWYSNGGIWANFMKLLTNIILKKNAVQMVSKTNLDGIRYLFVLGLNLIAVTPNPQFCLFSQIHHRQKQSANSVWRLLNGPSGLCC